MIYATFVFYHVHKVALMMISATNEMFSVSIVDHYAIGNSIFANTKVGHVLHHEYCTRYNDSNLTELG